MTIKIIFFSFLVWGMGESFVCSKIHWSFVQPICFFLGRFLIKDQIVIAWNKELKKGNVPSHFSVGCAVCMCDHMLLEHCNYLVVCCVQEEAQSECPHDNHSVKRFCALILLWWQMVQQHVSLQRQCGDPGSSFCTDLSVLLQKNAWSWLILDPDSIACQEVLWHSISAHSVSGLVILLISPLNLSYSDGNFSSLESVNGLGLREKVSPNLGTFTACPHSTWGSRNAHQMKGSNCWNHHVSWRQPEKIWLLHQNIYRDLLGKIKMSPPEAKTRKKEQKKGGRRDSTFR